MALAIALLAAWVVFLFEVDMRWHRASDPYAHVALPARLLSLAAEEEHRQTGRYPASVAEFRRLPTAVADHLSAIEYNASRYGFALPYIWVPRRSAKAGGALLVLAGERGRLEILPRGDVSMTRRMAPGSAAFADGTPPPWLHIIDEDR